MSVPVVVYCVGKCVILVDENDQLVVTRLPDGTEVDARPNTRPEDISLMKDLGYADTWAMSRDHELGHTWLAVQQGWPYSPVMWHLSHPADGMGVQAINHEEQRVLDWQRTLNKPGPRPWDHKQQRWR